ncbi:hypothetical protein [Desulfovibrio sp.]|nr:hypothetical protein [Desulfovibrio sp.]
MRSSALAKNLAARKISRVDLAEVVFSPVPYLTGLLPLGLIAELCAAIWF